MHVTAGGKIAAVGGEDHAVDVLGINQGAEHITQFGIAVESQRVLAIRAVQADRGYAIRCLPDEMFGRQSGHLGHVLSSSSRDSNAVSVSSSAAL